MNMRELLKQAQQMQEKMRRELEEMSVEVSVGGGMVSVTMNGHKELRRVHLDPEVVDPADISMLEDLVLAAVNQASRQVDSRIQETFGSQAASLPGLF